MSKKEYRQYKMSCYWDTFIGVLKSIAVIAIIIGTIALFAEPFVNEAKHEYLHTQEEVLVLEKIPADHDYFAVVENNDGEKFKVRIYQYDIDKFLVGERIQLEKTIKLNKKTGETVSISYSFDRYNQSNDNIPTAWVCCGTEIESNFCPNCGAQKTA